MKKLFNLTSFLIVCLSSLLAFSCSEPAPIPDYFYLDKCELDENICYVDWKDIPSAESYKIYYLFQSGTSATEEEMYSRAKTEIITESEYQIVCLEDFDLIVFVEALNKKNQVVAKSARKNVHFKPQFGWDYTKCKIDYTEKTVDLYWNESPGAKKYRIYKLESETKVTGHNDVIAQNDYIETTELNYTFTDVKIQKFNYFVIVSYYVDADGKEYKMYLNTSFYSINAVADILAFDWDSVYQEEYALKVFWTKCASADHYILYWTNNPDNYDDFEENYDNGTYESYTVKTNDGTGVSIGLLGGGYHKSNGATALNETYHLMVVAYDKNDKKISTPDSGVTVYHVTEPSNNQQVDNIWLESAYVEPYLKNNVYISWKECQNAETYTVYIYVDHSSISKTADYVISNYTDKDSLWHINLYYWEWSEIDKGKYAHIAVQAYDSKGKLIGQSQTTKTVRLVN